MELSVTSTHLVYKVALLGLACVDTGASSSHSNRRIIKAKITREKK